MMRTFLCLLILNSWLLSQENQPVETVASHELKALISEALAHNPEIQAARHSIEIAGAKASQAGSLDDPEIKFMQEGMPGLSYNEAMFSRLELMQMIPFPSKIARKSDLEEIRTGLVREDYKEKINEIISKLKTTYFELWFVQQNILLLRENIRIMQQFEGAASTRYSVGGTSQQDVLKAQLELEMMDNDLISLREKELVAKSMLAAILNRSAGDTLGLAVISDSGSFNADLDTLIIGAMKNRPMLKGDSLMVEEGETMKSMAKLDYLPDFKIGLERITQPMGEFKGWSVSVGFTLPFAPWTLSKAGARLEEASAIKNRSKAALDASRAMVASNVKVLYYSAETAKRQLQSYIRNILPKASQSLDVSLAAYGTGKTDFLMLLDAYRTLVNLKKEFFMTRMQFERTLAELEREAGSITLSDVNN